jgi:AraC-like DNA-binding protein
MDRPTDVIRQRSELGDWELATAAAHPALAGRVTRYAGYHERSPGVVRRREPATAGVVLVVSFGPTLRHIDPSDPTDPGRELAGFVAGPADGWSVTEYVGAQHGIQVDLSPIAAGRLLRVPIESLAGRPVRLEDVLERDAGALTERLAAAPGWEARFRELDSFLAPRAGDGRRIPAQVLHSFDRLQRTSGRVTVGALVTETGWSRRHLIARFREHLVLTPGSLARILRFRRALGLVEVGRIALAEIALTCGYYDQAHLDRDFRAFAGGPPTDYLARRVAGGPGVSAD